MASASMAQSLLRHRELRRLLPFHPPLAASIVSSSSPLRSFHTEGESAEDFENNLFGDGSPNRSSFYKKLDRVGSSRARFGMGFDSLNDGMNEKLDQAARTFVYSDEIFDEDYAFRPDVTYRRGSMYSVKDLDLTKPAAPKYAPRMQFETSTEEVLRKADFRNVRFLSNFLTEAGIIIKRSQTRISAKAQRKIAREIKTARAFGLMPFTTMGTKPFIFGRSMEETLQDYEHFGGVEQNAVGPGEEDAEPGEGDA